MHGETVKKNDRDLTPGNHLPSMIVIQRLGSKADGVWSQPLAIFARCLECFWTTYAQSRHST